MIHTRKFLPQFLGFLIFWGIFSIFPCLSHAAEETPVPRVLVSIKPLHSLVAGVMEGVGTPDLLVRGSSSPHHFSMRPSDARALDRADLLVWIGPAFESFLDKPLKNLGEAPAVLQLSQALAGQFLPADPSEGHVHSHSEDHGHAHSEGHEHSHAEDHGHFHEDLTLDYHFWLDPELAKETVALAARELAGLDPSRKDLYMANAEKMTEKLDALDQKIRKQLLPVQDVPFMVFHPAYQYFEREYDLNQAGVIALDPERQPGARKVAELRKKIRDLQVRCVFSEPQFESKLVETLVEGMNVRTGVLDPLGAELAEDSNMYFILLETLADNLVKGLGD